jgi:diketogulonate reductase-like aldo/keto reductase
MEYKELHRIKVPLLGFGTGGIGPNYSIDEKRDERIVNALRSAIEKGVTHIDTAERYGGGRSEELVGEAIKGFERDNLLITTKVLSENLRYPSVLESARASISRLGTHIDLYLIHKPNPSIPLGETVKALDDLVDKGQVRNIGVSNFPVEQMDEFRRHSKNLLFANQIEFSLTAREEAPDCALMQSKIVPYCQKEGIFIIAYKPLNRGQLAKPGTPVLDEITKKYEKTPAQIALNWLVSQKNVVAISKMTSPSSLSDNLGSIGWSLTDEDRERLNLEIKYS